MPLCDVCGKNTSTFRVNIENAILSVCENCSKFGINPTEIPILEIESKQKQKEQKLASLPEEIEIITKDFQQKIKEAREKLNLKQVELANKISEKESIIHKLESSQLTPSIELAKKLEKFLNIKLIELYKSETEKQIDFKNDSLTIGDLIKIKEQKRKSI